MDSGNSGSGRARGPGLPRGSSARVGVWMLMLAGMLLAGCGREASQDKPVIVASVFPLASIVQQIVGDAAKVEVLLPPGENPHSFDLTAGQMTQVAKADAMVVVGLGLDPWAVRAAHNADLDSPDRLLNFARIMGLETAEHEDHDEPAGHAEHDHASPATGATGHEHHQHGTVNSHLWLDLGLTIQFIPALSKALSQRYPRHRETIVANARRLKAELEAIDQEAARRLSAVPDKHLVTFHNAFDRLAERYGLKVVAHLTEIELAPGGEVTARDLEEAIKAIERYHLKVIYSEPQFPRTAMERLRELKGVDVLALDAEGNPAIPGRETYQAMIRTNIDTLVQGQSRPQPPATEPTPAPAGAHPSP